MKRFISIATVILVFAAVGFCQAPDGVPAKTGLVHFKLEGSEMTYDKVDGNFSQSFGFSTVTITYTKDGKATSDNLIIGLMMQKPGPVDLNQPGNGIQYRKAGTIFSYAKGKSQCTMTVTKLSASEMEGTAECPVINEIFGSGKISLTSVKFSASTK
jgi:hypothetical protein